MLSLILITCSKILLCHLKRNSAIAYGWFLTCMISWTCCWLLPIGPNFLSFPRQACHFGFLATIKCYVKDSTIKYLPVQASSQWSLRRGWREWDREHRGSRPQHSRNCWQNLWAGSSASARASPSLGLGGSRPSWRWQRTSTWRQESQLKLRSSKNKRKEGKGNVALIAHEWYFSSRLMPKSTTALHIKACYSPR